MTNIEQVKSLVDEYYGWLKEETVIKPVASGHWVEITTPMLDRHNDCIQLYVKQEKNGWLITDDSYTIDDLAASGCEIKSEQRQRLLTQVLNGFGVSQGSEDQLFVNATNETFAQKKHFLLQAILAVNDFFYTAKPTVKSFFFEDVSGWLDENEIRNSPRVSFVGSSHFTHQFDFVIPKSRSANERFIKLINGVNESKIKSAAFSWVDTRQVRTQDSSAFVIVNDEAADSLEREEEALNAYGMSMIPWSKRSDFVDMLAA